MFESKGSQKLSVFYGLNHRQTLSRSVLIFLTSFRVVSTIQIISNQPPINAKVSYFSDSLTPDCNKFHLRLEWNLPDNSYPIRVLLHRFQWKYSYVNGTRQFGRCPPFLLIRIHPIRFLYESVCTRRHSFFFDNSAWLHSIPICSLKKFIVRIMMSLADKLTIP